jgi:hypothetical protein
MSSGLGVIGAQTKWLASWMPVSVSAGIAGIAQYIGLV